MDSTSSERAVMNRNVLKARQFLLVMGMLGLLFWSGLTAAQINPGWIAVSELPPAAQQMLKLIKRGGPFTEPRDGIVFGNYEKILPSRGNGYYHEFTVKEIGAHSRGAVRIVAGGKLGATSEYYYSVDHYASFKRIKE
jgi:ribonuclease T1